MVSVVVPIYNEEELIIQFHEAIARAMNNVTEDWEAVYVNDGSTDSSLDLLRELQAVDPHVVVVELSRNWGHMGAVMAGLQTATGRAVILMDGDFQDPPEVLPKLIDGWRRGADIVLAVRRSRQERRKILAALFPLFYRVLGALSDFPIPLNAGIFSLMSRKAVDSLLSLPERNPYLPGMRAWIGYRNSVVYYDRQDRASGEGKLSFISRIKYAVDAITGFSYKPMRLSFRSLRARMLYFNGSGGHDVSSSRSGDNSRSRCSSRGIPCGGPSLIDRWRSGRVHRPCLRRSSRPSAFADQPGSPFGGSNRRAGRQNRGCERRLRNTARWCRWPARNQSGIGESPARSDRC